MMSLINEDKTRLIYQVKSCLVRFWCGVSMLVASVFVSPGFLSGSGSAEAGGETEDTGPGVGISL